LFSLGDHEKVVILMMILMMMILMMKLMILMMMMVIAIHVVLTQEAAVATIDAELIRWREWNAKELARRTSARATKYNGTGNKGCDPFEAQTPPDPED